MADTTSRLESALDRQYVVGRELGRGGMATVSLAHDLKHDRDAFLKVDPRLDWLRSVPRFRSLLERLRLAPDVRPRLKPDTSPAR